MELFQRLKESIAWLGGALAVHRMDAVLPRPQRPCA